jgi:hypothetical protein
MILFSAQKDVVRNFNRSPRRAFDYSDAGSSASSEPGNAI